MSVQIITGDAREILATLDSESVQCCVTSPPYFGLRDYGVAGQMGLEPTPDEYVAGMVAVFREVRRVLRADATLWLNIGDSYAGSWGARGRSESTNAPRADLETKHGVDCPARNGFPGIKPKDLIGIPWLLAFALRADGWYLRQDIIWSKPNPMPESVRDRCTKAHEYLFLLSKGLRYFYDAAAIAEPAVDPSIKKYTDKGSDKQRGHGRRHEGFNGRYAMRLAAEGVPETRNRRSVWTIATQPFSEAHFATFPPALIEPCILAGSKPGDMILDPFGGAGTTGLVADRLQRNATLIELNPEYAEMAMRRIAGDRGGLLDEMEAA